MTVRSAYLSGLSDEKKDDLRKNLWHIQKERCFICDEEIDFKLHKVEIDHIDPLATGGKDELENFALTHGSCNNAKRTSHLEVARILASFEKLCKKCGQNNKVPNLDDVLQSKTKQRHKIKLDIDNDKVKYSFSETGNNKVLQSNLYTDQLSGEKYFFAKIPIQYLFHDDKINPRPIGGYLGGLVEEFYKGFPQLQVPLAWIKPDNNSSGKIFVFDGQHKAAAQILLDVKELTIRIFVNPDLDKMLTANTHAGTTLKQVAFDKSIQRNLGGTLYWERIKSYQVDNGLADDNFSFSEQDLVNHFKGEWREMKKWIIDAQRSIIYNHADNKLKNYVESAGRGKEKPLSYSTVEKTFYSFFISPDLLQTSLDDNNDPRDLERKQILQLMNIIADEIFIDKFSFGIGTYRIENKIIKGEQLPDDHVIAYRLAKEEILNAWLGFLRLAITNFLVNMGQIPKEKKLFQYEFPQQLWKNITNFIRNLRKNPIWVNKQLAQSIFGGKQNAEYWRVILETGKTPDGTQVMVNGLNLNKMISE